MTSRHRGKTFASAALCLALAVGTSAAAPVPDLTVRPAPSQHPPDDQLVESVMRAVTTYPRFTIFDDINVQAEGGVVTLTGRVTMPVKKDELERRVSAVDGVKSVRNDIDILPASTGDDELRQRLARAIYGHAAFWRYAAMPHPPIHIVIEDGRVTLTGTVFSEADRTLARSLATGHGELSVTNALRTGGPK